MVLRTQPRALSFNICALSLLMWSGQWEPLQGQQGPQDLPDIVRQQAQERIDKGYHLGTVIGIIDKDGIRYHGFGQVSLADDSAPDEMSIFEIGSLGKALTAVLLADLDLKGEMSIQDPVEKYLPVFRDISRASNRTITLENLLTHTSGLPRNPPNTDEDDENRYRDYSVADLNEFLDQYAPDAAPPKYSYSNAGVLVLEHAIESQMRTTYEALMEERITSVLGMDDTHFTVPQEKRNRLVAGFRAGREVDELDVGQFPAMGGLRSTARDLLRFLGAQLGLYSSPLRDAIQATQSERFADDSMVLGLGWRIMDREESGRTIYHFSGGTGGFVSFAAFDIDRQVGVVVLANGRRWFSDLGFRVLDPTYPVRKDLPVESPR